MKSSSDKVRIKELMESLINRDSNKFQKIFIDTINEEYSNLVKNRFLEQVGSF